MTDLTKEGYQAVGMPPKESDAVVCAYSTVSSVHSSPATMNLTAEQIRIASVIDTKIQAVSGAGCDDP